MSRREEILAKIKSRQSDDDVARAAAVASRLQQAPRGVIPAFAQLNRTGLTQLFAKNAKTAGATVELVASADEVPTAVMSFARNNNLPAAARIGGDPLLAALPWDSEPTLSLTHGASDGSDVVGISHAANGVAETGTLMLRSGPGNPTTINFLPDCHVVVLRARDITGDYESSWDQLRDRAGKGVMPRTVNMVTGPSRSADIEQRLIMGAHGPRMLHIIVIKDA